MNSELSVELKDAGFPVEIRGVPQGYEWRDPTPSELIEALGDNLTTITRYAENDWGAQKGHRGEEGTIEFSALTLENALARLWLHWKKHS